MGITTITEAEELVRQELGEDYRVAKVSGYWIIGTRTISGGFLRVSPDPLRRSLTKAITDARRAIGPR